jgi:hypothetical protein
MLSRGANQRVGTFNAPGGKVLQISGTNIAPIAAIQLVFQVL